MFDFPIIFVLFFLVAVQTAKIQLRFVLGIHGGCSIRRTKLCEFRSISFDANWCSQHEEKCDSRRGGPKCKFLLFHENYVLAKLEPFIGTYH